MVPLGGVRRPERQRRPSQPGIIQARRLVTWAASYRLTKCTTASALVRLVTALTAIRDSADERPLGSGPALRQDPYAR
jgi:hypothetical protein